jgi:predicted Zn-dependent protease
MARESLARDPDQPRMVRLRAQALLKGGKVSEANKLLEDGMAKQPGNREYVVGLADLYAEQKRTDDALLLQPAVAAATVSMSKRASSAIVAPVGRNATRAARH